MNGGEQGSELARLRRRVESAIRRARGRAEIEPLLDRILALVEDSSDDGVFAHRQLAELLVEDHPWRAAMHLRKLAALGDADDVVHALMGLCQALMGNFRCAVSAYRRALRNAPRNPWYHHNLGHLLDVALGDQAGALEHLRAAHVMEPLEHEITASLAHCLALLGQLDEAGELAKDAAAAVPRSADHKALVAWIDRGAPAGETPHAAQGRRRRSGAVGSRPSRAEDVVRSLDRGMSEAGFSPGQMERARALWADYHDGRRLRVLKPEVYAAAIEYAIALVHRIDGVTQASIARRYGIAPGTLSNRYGEIRDALALRPGDPRYAAL